MDLKQLGYFIAIAEEGSISAAAKKLHISQPPLSQQLKLLESSLGVRLVERGPRRVTLTEAGNIFYKRANRILELSDAAVRELEDFGLKLSGTLRLGTTSSSGPALLSGRITEFCRSFPGVRFELHEGNTFELIELLAGGVIEIAIARTPFHAENVDSWPLGSEPMIAVAQEAFFTGMPKENISLCDLGDKPLILYRRFEQMILSACRGLDLNPNIFCKNDDARTSLLWADAGLGIAIMPKSMELYLAWGHCARKIIREPSLQSQVTAIWRNDRPLSAAAKNFLEVFRRTERAV